MIRLEGPMKNLVVGGAFDSLGDTGAPDLRDPQLEEASTQVRLATRQLPDIHRRASLVRGIDLFLRHGYRNDAGVNALPTEHRLSKNRHT